MASSVSGRAASAARTIAAAPKPLPFRFAGIQLAVGADKAANLERAAQMVRKAASAPIKADVVCLPECFNSPYGTQYFDTYAESDIENGESAKMLRSVAAEANVTLIGGSIPERDGDRLYNTNLVFGPDGKLLGKHRKMHLFDVDVPGGIKFTESETLSAGDSVTCVDTPVGRLGIGICYDIRFPELAHIMARDYNCCMLVYPGAFNMTTGPLHWELLARARAVDNQIWLAVVSPARDENATYRAWGHTSVVSPRGDVVATCEEREEIVHADVDPQELTKWRTSIPISSQRRLDVYSIASEQNPSKHES